MGIRVVNVSDATREPGISFARLRDRQGKEYLADAAAQIRARSNLFDEFPTGGSIDGRLIYDVPVDSVVDGVMLRETPESAGTYVPLG
ncbi:hypothetical protein [Actinoplanes sp. NPDC051851]|uniref:hypothetical protein n=1 Tax=Actinoplanes sp. NPDC051851 TaxID=3154753 RepID=UPI003417AEA2